MRKLFVLLTLAAWCIPSFALAQPKEKFQSAEIKKVHVGFKTYRDDNQTAYKVGLWTPIYIEVFGGTDGVLFSPKYGSPYLEIETADSEDVGTTIHVPCVVEPLKSRLFLGYIKTGHFSSSSRDIRVTLHAGGRTYKPFTHEPSFNLNMDAHLYLTLGPRVTEFHQAVRKIGQRAGEKKDPNDLQMDFNQAQNVVYENDVERLPEKWFGYNSIDLMILSTDKREFLTALNQQNNTERLKAIAQWVRRGGRLVVPISAGSQDAVHALLRNEAAWQPPIPVVPPKASAGLQFDHLQSVETWGHAQKAFKARNPGGLIPVATLDPGKVALGEWEVLANSGEQTGYQPFVAKVRYGLGQITYLAFSLQDDHFTAWEGREKFMQTMVEKLAPKAPANLNDQKNGFDFRNDGRFANDLTTQLLAELEKFGVTPIEFGYVALFIVLYILIVGPLDFFLLKYVFKRLEWTWITFPSVVLAVSVIAYFAAYALKGKDLKINKVDIVDFDMRTSLDPRQTRAYGHSYFAILSPRIQNYTIGLEPNPQFWGADIKKVMVRGPREADEVLSVDLLSWLGRPSGGMNEMGRSGSGGFFRKPYAYHEDASALEGVPIPVWTTKAFTASWEQPLAKAPFVVDLVYHQKQVEGRDLAITGKLENHLGVDLVDAWLHYDDKFYLLAGGMKSAKSAPAPGLITVAVHPAVAVQAWVNENAAHDAAPDDSAANAQQTRVIKQILVHEKFDTDHTMRNHLLRPLDLGWRIKVEPRGQHDRRTREAILIARVRYPAGPAETLTSDAKKPLPTKLWLGDIPNPERSRPTLSGQLNQDTYIRVILPIRPADE